MTYSKGKCAAVTEKDEKLLMVISIGYGDTAGASHKSKPMNSLCKTEGAMPDWFRKGMEAAQLAPTATNQQKFLLELTGDVVKAKALSGFYSKVDLGIVKYHFEIGAGNGDWKWE